MMLGNEVLLAFALVTDKDTSGIYGGIFSYAQIFAFVGSALLAFLYFWKKGHLDMDEEAKLQMMREDEVKKDGS